MPDDPTQNLWFNNDEAPRAPHPSTGAVLRYFSFDHLPAGPLRETSKALYAVAHNIAATVPPGPELTVGLRKLLEAKDCFVRASLPD